jgi:hypothetical protein
MRSTLEVPFKVSEAFVPRIVFSGSDIELFTLINPTKYSYRINIRIKAKKNLLTKKVIPNEENKYVYYLLNFTRETSGLNENIYALLNYISDLLDCLGV